MCGLFGFAGPGAHDIEVLAQAAHRASRRGPDGWGMLVDGRRHAGVGRLQIDRVQRLTRASLVLGHCRLATVIDTKRADCCQPVVAGPWAVTHNGTVGNVEALQRAHGFTLHTGVDSEALAHLLVRLGGRLDEALSACDTGGTFAVVAANADTGRVVMAARGLPLWILRRPEGTYWCSVDNEGAWEPVHA